MELFGPDAFSDPLPRFAPVQDTTRAVVEQVLTAGFPHLGPLSRLEQSGSQEINSNNFKARLGTAAFALKRVPADRDKLAQLASQALVAEALRADGLPCPRFEYTASGEVMHRHGGDGWCVQRFVEGQYFSGTDDEADAVAAMLGPLVHACVRQGGAVSAAAAWPTVDLTDENPAWEVLDHPEAQASLRDAEVAVLRDNAGTVRALRESLKRWGGLDAVDRTLTHIDLHPHNLLTRDGRLVAILDFESLRHAPARVVIAYGCYKLLRQVAVAAGASRHAAMSRFRSRLPLEALLGTGAAARHAEYALAEVLRRLCLVLTLNRSGDATWNHMIAVMCRAIQEVPIAFGARA